MSATEYAPSIVTLIGCNKALSSLHIHPHSTIHATEDKPSSGNLNSRLTKTSFPAADLQFQIT